MERGTTKKRYQRNETGKILKEKLSSFSQNSVTISLAPPGTTSHATGLPTGSSSPSRASLPCLEASSGRSSRARTLSTTTTLSFEEFDEEFEEELGEEVEEFKRWLPVSTSESSFKAAILGMFPLVRTRCRDPQSLRTPGAR